MANYLAMKCNPEPIDGGYRCSRCGWPKVRPMPDTFVRNCPSWAIGDAVAFVAEPIARAFGITSKRCGCAERKRKLNQIGVPKEDE